MMIMRGGRRRVFFLVHTSSFIKGMESGARKGICGKFEKYKKKIQ